MKQLLLDVARWLLVIGLVGGFTIQVLWNLTS
jgi:hypothetical protein